MTSDLKVKQESRGGRKEKIKKIRKVLKGRTHICHCLFYNKIFLHLLFIYYNLKYIFKKYEHSNEATAHKNIRLECGIIRK